MDVSRRIARSRNSCTTTVFLVFTILEISGCAPWLNDFSPSDYWPSKETWEKMSPSNLLYNLQPSQLNKLNRGPGMSSDVYYSISDPLDASGEKHAPEGAAIVEPGNGTSANGQR